MKKTLIAIAALTLGTVAYGQDTYASFSLGYGLGLPGETTGVNATTDGSGNTTFTNMYGSLGQGIGINLGAGIMLTDNFGLELGAQYFAGSEVTMSESSDGTDGSSTRTVAQSSQIRILPQLVVSSNNDTGLNIYAKSGLIIPAGGTTKGTFTSNPGTSNGPEVVSQSETEGQFSLGMSGTFGASYAISDKLSVFGELNGMFLRIKQGKSTVTSSTVNGDEQIDGTTPVFFTTTVFEDELTPESNGQNANPDLNSPDTALARKTNFGATFINIGVSFNF